MVAVVIDERPVNESCDGKLVDMVVVVEDKAPARCSCDCAVGGRASASKFALDPDAVVEKNVSEFSCRWSCTYRKSAYE